MKQTFIFDELWVLTISAAFQRANVYKGNTAEEDKRAFKKELRSFVIELTKPYSQSSVSELEHINNIKSLSDYTGKFPCLTGGRMNFGVSQKLFNLHLKYLWCLKQIETPPHFPVDRIIQEKLKTKEITAWTQMKDEQPYLKVINSAKEKLKSENVESLAELELLLFNRR